jgi:hypothetical protein
MGGGFFKNNSSIRSRFLSSTDKLLLLLLLLLMMLVPPAPIALRLYRPSLPTLPRPIPPLLLLLFRVRLLSRAILVPVINVLRALPCGQRWNFVITPIWSELFTHANAIVPECVGLGRTMGGADSDNDENFGCMI